MRQRNVSIAAHLALHNAALVPTLLTGSVKWVLQKKNERKMNVVEMRFNCNTCGSVDRIRGDVTVRMKKNVLSWFGHVKRMRHERMAKNIYDGKVSDK